MRIGCHVSISGSLDKAVDNAIQRDCSAFQIFTRNPRGWIAKKIEKNDAEIFKEKVSKSGISNDAICAHMPYLPNLSSPNDESFKKSVGVLVNEVERCGQLEIPFLVAHLGSHLGSGEESGIKRLVTAFSKAGQVKNKVTILLENTAGQKNSVGSDFEQLNVIFSQLRPSDRFGICFDTCHAFVGGYDLRTEKDVRDTFKKFDDSIGFENLKIVHLNDAKGELACGLDRHYHIGLGTIGKIGLSAIIKTVNKKNIPIILETPIDDTRDDVENIRVARGLA